jgi:hypothetical protein
MLMLDTYLGNSIKYTSVVISSCIIIIEYNLYSSYVILSNANSIGP